MKYEVEQKFPVDNLQAVESRLGELGAEVSDARVEVDVGYYVAGRCVVEVGSGKLDAKGRPTWVPLGEIDGKRSAEFRLPRESRHLRRHLPGRPEDNCMP